MCSPVSPVQCHCNSETALAVQDFCKQSIYAEMLKELMKVRHLVDMIPLLKTMLMQVCIPPYPHLFGGYIWITKFPEISYYVVRYTQIWSIPIHFE